MADVQTTISTAGVVPVSAPVTDAAEKKRGQKPKAKFTISEEDISVAVGGESNSLGGGANSGGVESRKAVHSNTGTAGGSRPAGGARSGSRFKVEFVGSTATGASNLPSGRLPHSPPGGDEDDDEDNEEETSGGGEQPSPPAYTPYHVTDSYDAQRNQKTFGQHTIETLPHVDHYRDMLTPSGAMRKRPTLVELHELDMVGIYYVGLRFCTM